jgi:hypothetical protein
LTDVIENVGTGWFVCQLEQGRSFDWHKGFLYNIIRFLFAY